MKPTVNSQKFLSSVFVQKQSTPPSSQHRLLHHLQLPHHILGRTQLSFQNGNCQLSGFQSLESNDTLMFLPKSADQTVDGLSLSRTTSEVAVRVTADGGFRCSILSVCLSIEVSCGYGIVGRRTHALRVQWKLIVLNVQLHLPRAVSFGKYLVSLLLFFPGYLADGRAGPWGALCSMFFEGKDGAGHYYTVGRTSLSNRWVKFGVNELLKEKDFLITDNLVFVLYEKQRLLGGVNRSMTAGSRTDA